MKNRQWTVRVVIMHEDQLNRLPGVWVEQLRHMGLIKVLAENDERQVIEFRAPNGITAYASKHWADTEAERMRSFLINAASAPMWDGFEKVTL